jgi:hypothetical protein
MMADRSAGWLADHTARVGDVLINTAKVIFEAHNPAAQQ